MTEDTSSTSVSVLAGLFLVLGILGTIELIQVYAAGTLNINLTVPLVFAIAYGLWRRHPAGRIGALIVAWVCAIGVPLVAVLVYLGDGAPDASFLGRTIDPYSPLVVGVLVGSVVSVVLIAAWAIRLLNRDAVRAQFTR